MEALKLCADAAMLSGCSEVRVRKVPLKQPGEVCRSGDGALRHTSQLAMSFRINRA